MQKIAVIDDVAANAELIRGYMGSLSNAAVSVFTCPLEAITWCEANTPDLVLLDYVMPKMDGIEFLRRFRVVDGLKHVPVVMITGEESKEALYQALYSGATDFLRKPVDRIELVARARNMLELHKHQRALVEANDKLTDLATTDSLTGVRNRRAFLDLSEDELARSRRFKRPFSVAMIDVDHFKGVNDTHGHAAGDEVLKTIARVCTQALRGLDKVGRVGGEEFAILFPELGITGARTACERLLAKIRETEFVLPDTVLKCTVSAGITEGGPGDDSFAEILRRADEALYTAKNSGRDQVQALL